MPERLRTERVVLVREAPDVNDREVAQLLAIVDVTWPGAVDRSGVPADVRVLTWSNYLRDATLDETIAAVRVCGLRRDRFPPGPGEVAGMVMDLRARAAGTSAPAAADAFAEVLAGVRRPGGWYSGPPEWSHPAIESVATAIGWDELCHGDVMIVRAHFMRLYEIAARETTTCAIEAIALASRGGPIRSLDAVLDDAPPALGPGGLPAV